MKRLYSLKFKKYIYYHWIQKSICRSYTTTTHQKKGRYHLAPTNHTLQFIQTTCTNTYDVNLYWDEFFYFHALITSFTKLKSYAVEIYPNLTNFFYYWFLFKKDKNVLLVGPKCITLACCKFGAKGAGPSWCSMYFTGGVALW
jgi:hypothetical protein